MPVIIITSGDPLKLKPKALAAGAVDFFPKPVNFVEFLVAVKRAINAPQQQGAEEPGN